MEGSRPPPIAELFANGLPQKTRKTTLEHDVAFAQNIYRQVHTDAENHKTSAIVLALQETPLRDNLATQQGIHVDWLLDVFFRLPFLQELMARGCQLWFLRKVGINELLRRRDIHSGPLVEHVDAINEFALSLGLELPESSETSPTATIFLAYTGRIRIDQFVDQLKYLRGEHVWLDICCVDQFAWTGHKDSLSVQQFSDKLVAELPELLKRIGRTGQEDKPRMVLLIERWNDIPYTLNQAWVLWEVWNAVRVGAEFSILMPEEEQKKFLACIQQGNVHQVQAVLGEIICGNAESDDKHAVKTILDEMKQVGYYNVSCKVVGQVRHWFQSIGFEHRKTLASDSHDRLAFSNNFAMLLQEQGCYGKAETLLKKTMASCLEVLGKEHSETFQSVSLYANVLDRLGQFEKAESLYTSAFSDYQHVLAEDPNPRTLQFNNNYAVLLDRCGRYDLAEPIFVESLAASRRVLGDKHTTTFRFMNSYAVLLRHRGRYSEAEPLAKAALEQRRRAWGDEHPITLRSKNTYAGLLHDLGRDREAEQLFSRTLEQRLRVLGDDHPDTLCSIHNYAMFLGDKRRYDEAEPRFKEALAKRRQLRGDEHPETARSLHRYGILLLQKGCYNEAERLCGEAWAILRTALGDNHQDTVVSRNDFHNVRRLQRRQTSRRLQLRQASDKTTLRRFLVRGDRILRAVIYIFVLAEVVPLVLFKSTPSHCRSRAPYTLRKEGYGAIRPNWTPENVNVHQSLPKFRRSQIESSASRALSTGEQRSWCEHKFLSLVFQS